MVGQIHLQPVQRTQQAMESYLQMILVLNMLDHLLIRRHRINLIEVGSFRYMFLFMFPGFVKLIPMIDATNPLFMGLFLVVNK